MAKDKFVQTKEDDDKKIGKSEKKFPDALPPMAKITFRQNRKFHLHLGRYVFTFHGRQSKEIPEHMLDHKDFTDNIKKYFVIHE